MEQWIDFARGVTPDLEAGRMANHAGRCAACRRCMRFWIKLAATAEGMERRKPRGASGS